ncbi:glutamine ABC transporter substrate-binding protein [Bacteroidales bacterium]|nr:glutamine ABC transporter substrate-binding protein [Bacteroidales bacterium]
MFLNTQSATFNRDFEEIKQSGVLHVVTDYNYENYFVEGDSIEGFQYRLCQAIEKCAGFKLQIHIENSLDVSLQGLKDGQYDIVARNIPITSGSEDFVAFTEPLKLNRQVLVQRTPQNNSGIPLLRNQLDLAKKTLYVPRNSPNILRLRNLEEEIADTIYIIESELYESEQLIYMVARSDIDYAVVDRQEAISLQKMLPEIDIKTDISFTQFQAWALRKDAPVLLDSINKWIRYLKAEKISPFNGS